MHPDFGVALSPALGLEVRAELPLPSFASDAVAEGRPAFLGSPMSTRPRKLAPSSSTTRGAVMSPFTRAVLRSVICS